MVCVGSNRHFNLPYQFCTHRASGPDPILTPMPVRESFIPLSTLVPLEKQHQAPAEKVGEGP